MFQKVCLSLIHLPSLENPELAYIWPTREIVTQVQASQPYLYISITRKANLSDSFLDQDIGQEKVTFLRLEEVRERLPFTT